MTDLDPMTVYDFKLVVPWGDPAIDGAEGLNEFTFTETTTGELRVEFIWDVLPPDAPTDTIKADVTFDVEEVGRPPEEWIYGEDLTAEAYWLGLPAENSAFGKKRVWLLFRGGDYTGREQYIEVFFPRDSFNNIGLSEPNWFYYWMLIEKLQTITKTDNVKYGGFVASEYRLAESKGLNDWNYGGETDKTLIYLYQNIEQVLSRESYQQYGVGEPFSGVDVFVAQIIHENRHVSRALQFDSLLEQNGSGLFRYGWSQNCPTFNQQGVLQYRGRILCRTTKDDPCLHNHWSVGPDRKWGRGGCGRRRQR